MHIKIKSLTENLNLVRAQVSDAAQQFGFDEESVNKIALSVDEACTNIIKHSYNSSPNNDIEIATATNNSRFEVIIIHQGASFDPKSIKLLNIREHLTQYRRGGLGMYLIRSLMDEVEYKSLPNKNNEVHLIKYLKDKHDQ